jgi:hypothetical protein
MKIEIHEINKSKIAYIISDVVLIYEVQDALDLMVEPRIQGSRKLIIHKKNLVPEFFDLSSGIAGEILQKFTNYKVQLAIVGDFSKYTSKSLKDFIFESNKHTQVNFVNSVDEAKERLSG